MPGASSARLVGSRPFNGKSDIDCVLTVMPSSGVVVSISSVLAVTVTVAPVLATAKRTF